MTQLLVPGAYLDVPTVQGGLFRFENFHNFTQAGDITVPTDEIFVFPIIGGPGIVETESGIRFESALWTLIGPGLTYDMGLDFDAFVLDGPAFTDNTLEVTGGIEGVGSGILIAEGVVDESNGDSLASKLAFILESGIQLQDHQLFPHSALGLEISKDLALFTGPNGGVVFASHFDQTFSTNPEVPEPSTWAAGLAMSVIVGGGFWRRRKLAAQ